MTEVIWTSLKFPDYRYRFFIECWWESLHLRTPHFQQARLLNPIACLHEMIEVIESGMPRDIKIQHLGHIVDEALEVLGADSEFSSAFTAESPLIQQLLKEISERCRSNSFPIKAVADALQLARYIHTERSRYNEQLCAKLFKLVAIGDAKEPVRRDLDELHITISRLISLLLADGFSPTYLYSRTAILTYEKFHEHSSPAELLNSFFERLLSPPDEYTVIQGITTQGLIIKGTRSVGSTTIAETIPVEIDGLPVPLDNFPPELRKSDGYFVAKVQAPDYIAAVWKMQSLVGNALDILAYGSRSFTVSMCSRSVTIHTFKKSQSIHVVDHQNLERRLTERQSRTDTGLLEGLQKVIESKNTGEQTKQTISKVLRYFRMGLLDQTFDSKFLSFWIALESMVPGAEKNATSRIANIVPSLYAFDAIRGRLRYFAYILSLKSRGHLLQIPESIKKMYSISAEHFPKHLPLDVAYQILTNTEQMQEIYDLLEGDEFKRFRICALMDVFRNREVIVKRYEKTKLDVQRQIIRIGRIRNDMVHTGAHGTVNSRVLAHLYDYVDCLLFYTINDLAKASKPVTLESLLTGYELALNLRLSQWRLTAQLDAGDLLDIKPVI